MPRRIKRKIDVLEQGGLTGLVIKNLLDFSADRFDEFCVNISDGRDYNVMF